MTRSRNQPQPTLLRPFYLVVGIIAVLGAAVLIWVLRSGGQAATEPVPVAIDPAELSAVQGISIGDPNAPVVIYEFADFQCPACGDFAALYSPLIKERLVDPGLARYVYYDFPLQQHPHAFLAARAGRCADAQGAFWPYHDLLYARQATWSGMGDPSGFFIELAEQAGLDEGQFRECLRSDRFAEEVSRSLRLGESLGVTGTPSLFVNMQRLPSIPPFEELEALVRRQAGAAADTAAPVPEPAGA